jgi:hypothetical protein
MTTTLHDTDPDLRAATERVLRRGLWLLPIAGALTLWATLEHQPDVTSEFTSWARFVTTDRFLAHHLVGSIAGQAIWILGAGAVTTLALMTGRRHRAALAGFALTVLGVAGVIAGFGVAAFAQPAIGNLELQEFGGAHAVYDDVYGIPTYITLIGGTLLFSVASIVLARAASTIDGVPRWAAAVFGAAGPLIGILGVTFGPFQTLGSLAAVVGGIGFAHGARAAARAGNRDDDLTMSPDPRGLPSERGTHVTDAA